MASSLSSVPTLFYYCHLYLLIFCTMHFSVAIYILSLPCLIQLLFLLLSFLIWSPFLIGSSSNTIPLFGSQSFSPAHFNVGRDFGGGAEMARMLLSLPAIDAGVGGLSAHWWDEINDSVKWQNGIFFALCGVYALVSVVALVSRLLVAAFFYVYMSTTVLNNCSSRLQFPECFEIQFLAYQEFGNCWIGATELSSFHKLIITVLLLFVSNYY